MKRIPAVCLIFFLASCENPQLPRTFTNTCNPISHLVFTDMSSDNRRALLQASEDFCSVLAGKPPVYAKLDRDFQPPTNSSTKHYLGLGYQLTWTRNARLVGGVSVGVVGPVLKFDSHLTPDTSVEISQMRVVALPSVH